MKQLKFMVRIYFSSYSHIFSYLDIYKVFERTLELSFPQYGAESDEVYIPSRRVVGLMAKKCSGWDIDTIPLPMVGTNRCFLSVACI